MFITLLVIVAHIRSFNAATKPRDVENSFSLEATDPFVLWPINIDHHNSSTSGKNPYFAVLHNVNFLASGPMANLGAVEFLGQSSSYIDIENNGDFDGTAAFTWMFYIKPYSLHEMVLLSYEGSSGSPGIQIRYNNELIIVRIFHSNTYTDYISQNVKAKLGTWSLVGVTYNILWPDPNLDIIMGSKNKDKMIVSTSDIVTTGNVRIGSAHDGSLPFDGQLSCIQFYNASIAGGEAMSATTTMCDVNTWSSATFVEPTVDIGYYTLIFTTSETDPIDKCMKFINVGNGIVLQNSFLNISTTSRLECVRQCNSDTKCFAFSINSSDTVCVLGSDLNVTSNTEYSTFMYN